ncbi:MAG: 30S ribosomal protein S2 [Victivallales bacterium]|nr:30S ribosomal protein S2 [Victivallales bacterium]MCF7889512.1 30S ribosomal protein S2 [Victivallales bacterium]
MAEKITVQDLMECGVHFGHQVKRWNPKMKDFVYGVRNGIHIIDLTKTMVQLSDACNFLQKTVYEGGNILFVGTKRQAQAIVQEEAEKTGMFHMAERWLGGTLTNHATIRKSINKMRTIDKQIENQGDTLPKKELASLNRNSVKLHKNLDGIAQMKKMPAAIVVVDTCNEHIAVKEAQKLNIPIVAIIDTNTDPEEVSYPIPGNDDAIRSIKILLKVIGDSVQVAAELYRQKAEEEKAEKAKKRAEEKERAKKEKEAKKAKRQVEKKDAAKPKPAAKKSVQKTETKDKPVAKKETAQKAAPKTKTEAGKEEPEKEAKAPVKEQKASE